MLLEKVFAVYAEDADTTFIMREMFKPNGEIKSRAVVGWHFGKPGDTTREYIDKSAQEY